MDVTRAPAPDNADHKKPCKCKTDRVHVLNVSNFFSFLLPPELQGKVPTHGVTLIQCADCKQVLALRPLEPEKGKKQIITVPGGFLK